MYAKIFKSMFDGTLRGRSDELLVFVNLLANSDRDGFVDRHFRAISEETGLSIDRVETAIKQLEAPDDESRSKDLEGRRLERIDEHRTGGWRIINYLKYRKLHDDAERREMNRVRQANFREKKSGTVPEKTEAQTPTARSYKPTLEEVKLLAVKSGLPEQEAIAFWNHYESNGWRVGRNPMKSVPHAMGTWKGNYESGIYKNRSRSSTNGAGTGPTAADHAAGFFNSEPGRSSPGPEAVP